MSSQTFGKNSILRALKIALQEPFPDNLSLKDAKVAVVHFYFNPNYSVAKISEAMDFIKIKTDKNINLRFGTTTDESMDINEAKVVIALAHFQ